MDPMEFIHDKKIVIVCGTGGVGKTSVTVLLGLQAASSGKKTVILTVDPAKALAKTLKLDHKIGTLQFVERGKNGGSLSAVLLDPKQIFDNVIRRFSPTDTVRDSILGNPLYQNLSTMMAGSQEYMAMEKLYELVEGGEFDLIIIDTPPAEQAVAFFKAPETLINAFTNSLLKWLISPSLVLGKLGKKLLNVFGSLTGKEILNDVAGLFGESIQLMNGFVERARHVAALLHTPTTAFVLVVSAKSNSISDALNFLDEMSKQKLQLQGLFINHGPWPIGSLTELEKTAREIQKESDPFLLPFSSSLQEQIHLQKSVTKKFQKIIRKTPWHVLLPTLPTEVHDLPTIRHLATFLSK